MSLHTSIKKHIKNSIFITGRSLWKGSSNAEPRGRNDANSNAIHGTSSRGGKNVWKAARRREQGDRRSGKRGKRELHQANHRPQMLGNNT